MVLWIRLSLPMRVSVRGVALFVFFLLWSSPVHGREIRVSKLTATISLENALYDFYCKEYLIAASQFRDIIRHYPDFRKQKSAVTYYVISLSQLQQFEEVQKTIDTYQYVIDINTIFSFIDIF